LSILGKLVRVIELMKTILVSISILFVLSACKFEQLPQMTPASGIGSKENKLQEFARIYAMNNEFFIIQPGTPVYLPNFIMPASECNWMGVAGQVFDKNLVPISNLIIEVGGMLSGNEILFMTLTSSALEVGPGGYVITLANQAISSSGDISIRVRDLSGAQLSADVPFETYANCDQNLIIINFIESDQTSKVFFPAIYK